MNYYVIKLDFLDVIANKKAGKRNWYSAQSLALLLEFVMLTLAAQGLSLKLSFLEFIQLRIQ